MFQCAKLEASTEATQGCDQRMTKPVRCSALCQADTVRGTRVLQVCATRTFNKTMLGEKNIYIKIRFKKYTLC